MHRNCPGQGKVHGRERECTNNKIANARVCVHGKGEAFGIEGDRDSGKPRWGDPEGSL